MEDFGYSKQQEESPTGSIIKRAFLIGATLFSIACFIYVTINAYYFFLQDKNADIETIKAEADPIKVTETSHEESEDVVKINNSIYEDIFNNNKYSKEKEVKIRETASPALPPKSSNNDFANKKTPEEQPASLTQNSAPNQNTSNTSKKNGQIIVYSESLAEGNKNILIEKEKTEKRTPSLPQSSPHELAGAIVKPINTKKTVKVQIAALTSRDSANEYWIRLQKLYPGLFSGLKSFIEQVDLGKRGIFYRLQIGNFFDQIKAEEFCNRYIGQTQKNKADCIVVE